MHKVIIEEITVIFYTQHRQWYKNRSFHRKKAPAREQYQYLMCSKKRIPLKISENYHE